ncbi:MAG: IS630 family transposase [bacterium]
MLRYKERDYEQRIQYLQALRAYITEQGSEYIVYIDETGFEKEGVNTHGWSKQGKRLYGEQPSNRRPRTSLVAGKWNETLLAPVLFAGVMDGIWFHTWLQEHLLPELPAPSLLILDNAPFHKKAAIRAQLEGTPHTVLFLPPYSPDFNPIEQVFAWMKNKRKHVPDISLDELVLSYGSFLS